jgi:2-oxoglutarate dehydrogenase complex dehydrogenase (E1) component-like enzyme
MSSMIRKVTFSARNLRQQTRYPSMNRFLHRNHRDIQYVYINSSNVCYQRKFSSHSETAAETEDQSYNVVLMKILHMVRSFRNRGHFAASLDPLAVTTRSSLTDNIRTPIYSTNAPTWTTSTDRERIQTIDKLTSVGGKSIKGKDTEDHVVSSWLPENPGDHPDVVRMLRNHPILDLSIFGLENVDKTVRYDIGDELSRKREGTTQWTVPEISEALIQTYCGNVGAEYLHIETESQRDWLKNKIEGDYGPSSWTQKCPKEQIKQYETLLRCDYTARFLNYKFKNAKVFGIEGCDSLLPGLMSTLRVHIYKCIYIYIKKYK